MGRVFLMGRVLWHRLLRLEGIEGIIGHLWTQMGRFRKEMYSRWEVMLIHLCCSKFLRLILPLVINNLHRFRRH